MEPRNRKVNWRRRQAVFSLELACLVGLCGLGYLSIAIALGVLTVVLLLQGSAGGMRHAGTIVQRPKTRLPLRRKRQRLR